MKKFFISTTLTLFFMTVSFAQTFTVDGLDYTVIDANANEVEITGGTVADGHLIILATVLDNTITYTVTRIGGEAFEGAGITSVSMPTTLTRIRGAAFQDNDLTSIVIPSSITSIGNSAFRENNLAEVLIPDSVTTIGTAAFRQNSLTSVTIGNTVTSIGNNAFRDNPDLVLVTSSNTIPPNLGTAVFTNMSAIALLTVPEGAETAYATAGWDNFFSVNGTFSGTITFIRSNITYTITARSNTANTVKITGNTNSFTDITIPSEVTRSAVIFSVTEIGDEAFRDDGITSVVIPDGVTRIGNSAFRDNDPFLESVSIGSTVTRIDNNAFRDNDNLASVTSLNTTPPTLGNNVFDTFNFSKTLTVPEGTAQAYRDAGWLAFNTNNEFSLQQIGSDISVDPRRILQPLSPTFAQNSISLSDDGLTMAIGELNNSTNGIVAAGRVRVYQNTAGVWIQIGDDFLGEDVQTFLGSTVSLSGDGTALAILANLKTAVSSSSDPNQELPFVAIYKNVGGVWTQLGTNIEAEELTSFGDNALHLSKDGTTVSIGDESFDQNVPGKNGKVQVYTYNVTIHNWELLGQELIGITNDRLGEQVRLSDDGKTLAIAADAGNFTRVFRYDINTNTWVQLGEDIDFLGSGSSSFIDLSSDGTTVVLGNPFDDTAGTNSGVVQAFTYNANEDDWQQLGDTLRGEGFANLFGSNVDLSSNGQTLIVGAEFDLFGGGGQKGGVHIYQLTNTNWLKTAELQTAVNENFIIGSVPGSLIVTAADDANTIAILDDNNVNGGLEDGVARVFDYTNALITTKKPIALKVALQGASLNPIIGEENLMRDDLRANNLIPLNSPYSDGATVDPAVFDTEGENAIVDWVFLELSEGTDNENTTVVASTSALLQRDGDIVGLDGIAVVTFTEEDGDYFVAIKHRNHIGVMAAVPASLSGAVSTLDFTQDAAFAKGEDLALTTLVNGNFAMIAGDADGSSQILNTDISEALTLAGGGEAYSTADADMNGFVLNSDIQLLVLANSGTVQQFD